MNDTDIAIGHLENQIEPLIKQRGKLQSQLRVLNLQIDGLQYAKRMLLDYRTTEEIVGERDVQ